MNTIYKIFSSTIGIVSIWSLVILAGWLGGFALNYYGLPGEVACMVAGTVIGLVGFAYAFVRSNKKKNS